MGKYRSVYSLFKGVGPDVTKNGFFSGKKTVFCYILEKTGLESFVLLTLSLGHEE